MKALRWPYDKEDAMSTLARCLWLWGALSLGGCQPDESPRMEVAEMDEQGNLQVVQGLYAAFGRGDMQAVLDAFADEVDWLVPGAPAVPWAGPRTSREQIAAYFDLVGELLDIQEHDVQEYLVHGDRVVVFGREKVLVKATNRTFETDWVHLWEVRDGKVVKLRLYADTAAIVVAVREE